MKRKTHKRNFVSGWLPSAMSKGEKAKFEYYRIDKQSSLATKSNQQLLRDAADHRWFKKGLSRPSRDVQIMTAAHDQAYMNELQKRRK